jgi:serine protease Do
MSREQPEAGMAAAGKWKNVPRFATRMLIAVLLTVCSTHCLQGQSPDPVAETDAGSEAIRQGLRLTPRALRAAVARIEPSLVAIESFGGSSTSAGRIGGIRQRGEGNTTGLVVSADGLVVTSSFNFIDQPTTITVITSDGVRRVANVLGRDDSRRICLLRVEGISGLPVPDFVPVDQMHVGQWAVSVGVGYGDSSPAISMGILSAVNRMGGKAIQTDANISPANYGGPLIDIEGRLLGICVPMSAEGQDLASGVEWYDSGIGFAIPLAGAGTLIQRMSEGIHIQRAFLGIQSENSGEAGSQSGIRITEIIKGSAAELSGLQPDDILLQLDGAALPNVAELRNLLARYYAGDSVTIVFRRGEEENSIEVELGAPPRPEAEDTPSLFPGRRRK